MEKRKEYYKDRRKRNKDLLTSYNYLGSCYADLGDAHKAIPYFEQSHQLAQDFYSDDPNNSEITVPMANLALAFRRVGRLEEALHLTRQVLRHRSSKPSTRGYANTLITLGSLLLEALAKRHWPGAYQRVDRRAWW